MEYQSGARPGQSRMGSRGSDVSAAAQNLLLTKLPAEVFSAISEKSDIVRLSLRDVVLERDQTIEHVYFPTTAMVSLLSVLADGTAIEVLTIGHEGMLGLPLFHGVDTAPERAVCQIAGQVLRLPAPVFATLLADSRELHSVLHLYSQFANDAIAQSAACNTVHLLEQRCARWLLITSAAVRASKISLTQEFLAQMLAVRRSGVTEAMKALERQELITTHYGEVVIIDKPGLEQISCECYRRTAERYRQLLG